MAIVFDRPPRCGGIAGRRLLQSCRLAFTPRGLARAGQFAGGEHRFDHFRFGGGIRRIEILVKQGAEDSRPLRGVVKSVHLVDQLLVLAFGDLDLALRRQFLGESDNP